MKNNNLHLKVAAIRENLGLSQSDVAQKADLLLHYIDQFEAGWITNPDTIEDIMKRLAKVFDMTIEEIENYPLSPFNAAPPRQQPENPQDIFDKIFSGPEREVEITIKIKLK